MNLVSVAEMKQIEAAADSHGYSYEMMMLKAGNELARVVHREYYAKGSHHVVGLVGSGNNGGDTLVALSALSTLGWSATAILLKTRPESDRLVQALIENGGTLLDDSAKGTERKVRSAVESAQVILDGVLGTGFKLPLSAEYAARLNDIRKALSAQTVVAVDCPSGVDCDSGEVSDETLDANLTVCMDSVKQGLVRMPAFLKCGEIVTVDLGIPKNARIEPSAQKQVADQALALRLLPERPRDAHKGTFGTVMVIGGSVNYTGAPVLSGWAAYRIGAGLVQMAVPSTIQPQLSTGLLEATWLLLDDEMGAIAESSAELVQSGFEKASALVLGPGLGRDETTSRFVEKILLRESEARSKSMGFIPVDKSGNSPARKIPPFVIDADGLRILAQIPDWSTRLEQTGVLTPHPGEMAALTGLKLAEVQQDREAVALRFASQWRQVVVLKGALTVIAEPEGRLVIIPVASSALAKAGSGDVLSGMIVGLMSQGVKPFDAAVAGAWFHARAGILAAEKLGSERSVMPRDVIESIPLVLK